MSVTLEEVMDKLNAMEEKLNIMERRLSSMEKEFGEFRQEVRGKLSILEQKIELQEVTFKTLARAISIRDEDEEDFAGVSVREGTGFNTTRVKRVRSPLI